MFRDRTSNRIFGTQMLLICFAVINKLSTYVLSFYREPFSQQQLVEVKMIYLP